MKKRERLKDNQFKKTMNIRNKEKNQHTKYYLKDGTEVPSVTTVIHNMINKPSLYYWSNKLGLNGLSYQSEMNKYSDIGTKTHKLIEEFLKDLTDNPIENHTKINFSLGYNNQIYNAYESFLQWYDKQEEVNCIYSEKKLVYEKLKYGGTLDFYGIINGKYTILDFKTSNYFGIDMIIQLSAYYKALKAKGKQVEQVIILKLNKQEIKYEELIYSVEELNKYFSLFKILLQSYTLYKELEKDFNNHLDS